MGDALRAGLVGAAAATSTSTGLTASTKLAADLQRVLADLIVLHLRGKQAHWTVVARDFRDLHLQLDGIVDDAREFSDTFAERMRALNAIPGGRANTVAGMTTLPVFPLGEQDTSTVVDLVTERLRCAVGTMRAVHDEVGAEDPSTADLLHAAIDRLERQAWMLSAENRGG